MTILASLNEIRNNSHPVSTCKKTTKTSLVAALIAVSVSSSLVAPKLASAESASADALFKKGQAEYAAKKYKEAKTTLAKAAELSSRNVPLQYYLGLAGVASGDTATLARAMARIVVMSPARSANSKRALDTLKRYSSLVPISAMDGTGVSRFDRKDMPIKVHVTAGKMLPTGHGYAMSINTPTVIEELTKNASNPQFFARLQTDPGYQSNMGSSVMQGINKWQFLNQEKVLSYVFENDPTKADIVVFWLPQFEAGEVGHVGMKAYTAFLNTRNPAQRRVYMQFATGARIPRNIINQWTTFSAAHEFGHALGLTGHSPNDKDIMTDKLIWQEDHDGNGTLPGFGISENDKISMRALYDITPDITR